MRHVAWWVAAVVCLGNFACLSANAELPPRGQQTQRASVKAADPVSHLGEARVHTGHETKWPLGGIVVDGGGKLLSGVTVVVRQFAGSWLADFPCLEARTDKEGKWSGTAPAGRLLLVFIHREYVRLEQILWFEGGEERFAYLSEAERAVGKRLTRQLTNQQYRVAMRDKTCVVIGGLVVDREGRGIPGAKIDFYFHRDEEPAKGVELMPHVKISPPDPIVSDTHGRWRWNNAPQRLSHLAMCADIGEDSGGVKESVIVPSFPELADRNDANTKQERRSRCEQLLGQTYRIGAYRPFGLQGVVVDEEGRSVEGARVSIAVRAIHREKDQLSGKELSHQVTIGGALKRTDENGRFWFDSCYEDPRQMDEYQVMIQRDGCPVCCWVRYPFPDPGESIRLVLPEGETFEVAVVDAATRAPVAGASVVPPPFYVQKDLRYPRETVLVVPHQPSLKADANGIIRTRAPLKQEVGELRFEVSAGGYEKASASIAPRAESGVKRFTIPLTRTRK